ncbi:MAG: ABC transporter ATP-binding protein, partial [Gammaproteobacteria bacterium]|nr:ABC transporter ATP-binding protein [Gammaproteobacteria bacterium]
MSALILKQFGVKRGPCPVLQNISFELAAGEFVGLVGPNGAGKTTLMRGMQGLLPHSGFSNLSQMNTAQRALHAAWMPQEREVAWPILVEDVLRLGRAPHRSAKAVDQAAVDAAIEQFSLQTMRTRPADQLSGGEQARVLLARAVVQQTLLLLADEPI